MIFDPATMLEWAVKTRTVKQALGLAGATMTYRQFACAIGLCEEFGP
jgi:hypothetical protein